MSETQRKKTPLCRPRFTEKSEQQSVAKQDQSQGGVGDENRAVGETAEKQSSDWMHDDRHDGKIQGIPLDTKHDAHSKWNGCASDGILGGKYGNGWVGTQTVTREPGPALPRDAVFSNI